MLTSDLSLQVLQALPQLVSVYDRNEGRLIYLNHDPLGYTIGEVLAMDEKTMMSLFPSRDDASILWLRMQAIQSGSTQTHRLKLRGTSGEIRSFSVRFSVCGTTPNLVMGFWEDITERVNTETILQENDRAIRQLKHQLMGHFSHEFRTPLSIIMVATELLRLYGDKLSDEKKLSQYDKIAESVQRVINLLNNLSVELGVPQTGA